MFGFVWFAGTNSNRFYASKDDIKRFKKALSNEDQVKQAIKMLNDFGTTFDIFEQIVKINTGKRNNLKQLRIKYKLQARSACMI